MPDVSVVLTTRNRWNVLAAMGLRGARLQQGVEHEIIVVDDGSIDKTSERIRELADARITVLNGGGRGPSHARNVGLAAVNSEFVAFLDDDDAWAPHKLRAQIDEGLRADADFIYSPAVVVDEHLVSIAVATVPPADTLRQSLLVNNPIAAGGSNVLFRTELVREVGGFDEELFVLEDWDLFLRLAQVAKPAVCDEILIAYVVYRRQPSNRFERDPVREFRRMNDRFPDLRAVSRNPEIAGARWQAFEHRRSGHRLLAALEYLRSACAYRSPANALRAVVVLAGEPILQIGKRGSLRRPAEPAWLDHYR